MLHQFDVYRVAQSFHWSCIELRLHRVHRDQIFRASSSIVLNIAEGAGKRTLEEKRKHYAHALGSLRECQAILDLERIANREIRNLMDRLGAMLHRLSKEKSKVSVPDTDTDTITEKPQTDTDTPNGNGKILF